MKNQNSKKILFYFYFKHYMNISGNLWNSTEYNIMHFNTDFRIQTAVDAYNIKLAENGFSWL